MEHPKGMRASNGLLAILIYINQANFKVSSSLAQG